MRILANLFGFLHSFINYMHPIWPVYNCKRYLRSPRTLTTNRHYGYNDVGQTNYPKWALFTFDFILAPKPLTNIKKVKSQATRDQYTTTLEKVRYELLRPEEIISARDQFPVAYVPLGPLEWHGPHLPFGVDMLHAYSLALEAARKTGGIVLPALPLGSETVLEPDRVRDRGFEGQEKIVGMDFPGLSLPSLYIEDSAFGLIIHEIIRGLKRQHFRVIVLVNGHGGKFHLITLDRIAAEETESGIATVLHAFHLDPGENKGGHAEKWETGLMMLLYGNTVDINALPPFPDPLKSREFGILDLPTCFGQPTDDYNVRTNQDPRLASEKEGKASFEKEVEMLTKIVQSALLEFGPAA